MALKYNVPIGVLCIALLPGVPYGFYILVRLIIFIFFVNLAIESRESNQNNWLYLSFWLAFTYNPILPIHLTRDIWPFINIGTIIIVYKTKKLGEKKINKFAEFKKGEVKKTENQDMPSDYYYDN